MEKSFKTSFSPIYHSCCFKSHPVGSSSLLTSLSTAFPCRCCPQILPVSPAALHKQSHHCLFTSTHDGHHSHLPFHPPPITDRPRSPLNAGCSQILLNTSLKSQKGVFTKINADTTYMKSSSPNLGVRLEVKKQAVSAISSAIPLPLLFPFS